MRSGFFNSNITGYDENNNPIYDRAEEASFFAEFFADFIGNGVYPNPSTGMQVIATTGLQVKVQEGSCFINGYRGKVEEGGETLTLNSANTNYPRIDRIVARLSIANREITLEVLEGTPTSNPIALALTRNSNIYEIALADVTVEKGVSTITQANITDTRLNSSLCGMVSGVVEQLDTTTLFNQYQTWFNEMKSTASDDYQEWFDGFTEPSEQEFTTWFEEMKNQLSEDAAGNLQLQIDDIEDKLETLNQDGIIVSPTEPTTDRRKVWMQKGKNLIEKIINGLELYTVDGSVGRNDDWCITNFISIVEGQNYVSDGLSSNNKWWYDESFNFISKATDNPSLAPANAKYVRLNSTIAGKTNPILVQGTSVGTYEEYVKKNIYIKNDNDVYEIFFEKEEIYSLGEIKIGNWIDGKPLYRRVLKIPRTSISSSEPTVINVLENSNIVPRKIEGMIGFQKSNVDYPVIRCTFKRYGLHCEMV